MESKHKVNNLSNMIWILYILLSIYPLKALITSGIVSSDMKFFQFVERIQAATSSEFYMFQAVFLFALTIGIITESKNIVEIEDEEKIKTINKMLIKYKLFIFINILGVSALLLLTKDKSILPPSILLILTSILIHFTKQTYFKSYLFDRQRIWLEKISEHKYEQKNIDTKKWRYKIWFGERVKVNISDRKLKILANIIKLVFFGYFFSTDSFILIQILFGVMFIKGLLALIENIFSLFTTIDGVCTGIYEERTKNTIYYRIIVTDYDKKRELSIKARENFAIEPMDKLSIVHGMFSKHPISIDNFKLNKTQRASIFPAIIILVFMITPIINTYLINNYISTPFYEENTESSVEYEETYIPRNLSYFDDLGNYRVIDINNREELNSIIIQGISLYLGENQSKLFFYIINNSSSGMVLNLDSNSIISGEDGQNSNILLPGKSYHLELDILETFDPNFHNELVITLEYTLSDTILNKYLDFNTYNYYHLNVVDNNCSIIVDLENNSSNMKFNVYDQFYTKQDKITRFQKRNELN